MFNDCRGLPLSTADAVRRIVAAAEAASGVQPVSRYVAPEPFGHAARDRPD